MRTNQSWYGRERALARGFRYLGAIIAGLLLQAGVCAADVIDVLGHLAPNDFSAYVAPQSYRDWGNEPVLAVNPLNPQELVVSSFAYGAWISSTTAQLWYSSDGGASWSMRFPVPTPLAGSTFFIDDQIYAFDSTGVLHGAIMALDSTGNNDYIYHGTTTNLNSSSAWVWNAGPFPAASPDQPWLALGGATVAVAYDDFSAPGGVEQRVALSTNNGLTFPAALNMAVGSPGGVPNGTGGTPQNYVNPGLRAAVDALGHAYVIYGMATNGSAIVPLMNYRLNRYSGGPGWDFTSASADRIGGLAITNGPSRQGTTNAFWFGNGINALLGNITAIAVNTNGSRVYAVYGLTGTNGIGRLFLQQFTSSGANLLPAGPPLPISSTNYNAALPSVAVATNGAVAVMFDEFDGANFHVRLSVWYDVAQTLNTNLELYSFTTNGMVLSYGTRNHNRLLGDYQFLLACGTNFYGVFAGRGNVASGSINTTNFIDPFFFSFSAVRQFAPPVLSGFSKQGTTFHFTLNGETNVSYLILESPDLVTWSVVATNTASGAVRPIDVPAPAALGYYRAVVNP